MKGLFFLHCSAYLSSLARQWPKIGPRLEVFTGFGLGWGSLGCDNCGGEREGG